MEAPYREKVLAVHDAWGDLEYWRAMQSAASPFTARYQLAAVDLQQRWDGGIEPAPKDRAVYRDYLARTFIISLVVTLLCCAIGYPMAYVMASAVAVALLLMVAVVFPLVLRLFGLHRLRIG